MPICTAIAVWINICTHFHVHSRYVFMRCSIDLRKRVLEFVNSGSSKSEAARIFKVSRSSIYTWLKSQDALSYRKPGPTGPRSRRPCGCTG